MHYTNNSPLLQVPLSSIQLKSPQIDFDWFKMFAIGIIEVMEFLSQVISKEVVDDSGGQVGHVSEVIVRPSEPLPLIAAWQVKTEDGALFLPSSSLHLSQSSKRFKLKQPLNSVQQYMPQPHDFSLVRDVLDKQIVDMHDYRVVRVNDIQLAPLPNSDDMVLVGVDIGVGGIARRLGLQSALNAIQKLFNKNGKDTGEFISWQDVASLPTHNTGEPIKLKLSHENLSRLHPADLGEILNQMDPAERNQILEGLDVETAADALAEAEDDVQVSALRTMNEERAADILEEMPADEAADVLGDLDKARRDELLGHMEDEDREDVTELLSYGDDTAGGMMTNEYVAISQDLTASETIEHIRALSPDAETIYYIYVVDSNEHLTGVISLRDLIVADPSTHISEFMISHVVSLPVNANLQEIAHKFERYKLLAIPVHDHHGKLIGIITVDDTLEQLLPDNWRKRPTRNRDRMDRDHENER